MAKATAVISVALAGAMLLPAASAVQAGSKHNTYIENNTYVENNYYHKHNRKKHKKRGIKTGEAVAIGVMGLAAGMILNEAFSQPQYVAPPPPAYRPPAPAYRPPAPAQPYYPPVVTHRPAPVYQAQIAAPAPWSPAWFAYCTNKYRSFNPNTGTYRTYSGKNRFCQ